MKSKLDMNFKEEKMSEEKVKEIIRNFLRVEGFTARKLTDTPTDANQVVPRKFVTLNGTTANRPTTKIPAQFYFDKTIGRPVYFNPNSSVWTDGAGSVS